MKTLQRSSESDERAMADLAEVPDWNPVWGPPASGLDAVRSLAERVSAVTGWRPWAPGEIDPNQYTWGLVTPRSTVMVVLPDAVLPDSPRGGWSAYDIGPDDVADAEAGLDAHWPGQLALARHYWGAPGFVGSGSDPRIPAQWRDRRRHLAVWLRPGAEIHLYSGLPSRDSATAAVGFGYSVYASEVA